MPEAPAATPVLSTTTTSSPALARCQAVERPWTPAPTTRCLTEAGREGGTGGSFEGLLPMTQWHCQIVATEPSGRRRPAPGARENLRADRRTDHDRLGVRPARLGVEPPLEAARRADEHVPRGPFAPVGERVVAAGRREG